MTLPPPTCPGEEQGAKGEPWPPLERLPTFWVQSGGAAVPGESLPPVGPQVPRAQPPTAVPLASREKAVTDWGVGWDCGGTEVLEVEGRGRPKSERRHWGPLNRCPGWSWILAGGDDGLQRCGLGSAGLWDLSVAEVTLRGRGRARSPGAQGKPEGPGLPTA